MDELLRLARLWWRYRHLQRGSPSAYAGAALHAQEAVERLRVSLPGRNFVWFWQPQPLDSPALLIEVWEYARRGADPNGPGRLPPFLRRLWIGSVNDIISGEVDLFAVFKRHERWGSEPGANE